MAFKRIDNIAEYVHEGIITKTLSATIAEKAVRVQARQGKVGEIVQTIMKNGLHETQNIVELDEATGKPGWIVTNPNGEEYVIKDSTFQKKYEIDPEDSAYYLPKGGPVMAVQIGENIEFIAPWEEPMRIAAGGYLIVDENGDIYGIQEEEFRETYTLPKEEY